MSKEIYLIIIFLLAKLTAFGQLNTAPEKEHLNSYLITAADNNPGLKAKFNQYLSALEKVPQARSLPDPQLAFAYFISPVETRMGPQRLRISASQFFPWFGTLESAENAAICSAKARYEEFEEAKSSLFKDIKSVYYELYFLGKSDQVTMESLSLLNSMKELVSVKVQSGKVTMLDDYRIRMEINMLENQLALIRDKRWARESEFYLLINEAGNGKEVILPDDLWEDNIDLSLEAVSDSVIDSNHEILELRIRDTELAYKKETAEKMGLPGIKLGFDYIFTGQGSNNLQGKDALAFPSIGISLPIYREKYRSMVKEVEYMETANTNARENKSNMLKALLDRVWKDYLDADRRISLNRDQMDLSQKSLKILESEYAGSNADFEEILRMERNLLNFSLEFEKARADKQAAIAFIDYLMGK